MNFPQIVEHAIRETIREFAGEALSPSWLRSSQVQSDVANQNSRQYFPQMLITSSSKFMESAGCTWAVSFEVACITWFEDDEDASVRALMFREAERILDHLIEADGDDEIQRFFIERITERQPTFVLGGMTPEETTPEINNGAQIMPYRGTLHFSL